MTKILAVCALKHEFVNLTKHPIKVIYTGIGKINASHQTTRALCALEPDLIINVGTAGAINKDCHGMLEVTKVIQRDMMVEPFAKRGVTPFCPHPAAYYPLQPNNQCNKINEHNNYITCGTGDSFVNSEDPWLIENKIDIVDMELFAIATVAYEFNIPWRSFKFISDEANSAASKKWQQEISSGIEQFNTIIDEICKLDRG